VKVMAFAPPAPLIAPPCDLEVCPGDTNAASAGTPGNGAGPAQACRAAADRAAGLVVDDQAVTGNARTRLAAITTGAARGRAASAATAARDGALVVM